MLRLIVGLKGTGKTKELISLVNEAAEKSEGKTVCVEKGNKLTYNINHDVRLIDTEEFKIAGYDSFYGFIAGIVAGDFDVKDIFIDSVLKICGSDLNDFADFAKKIDDLSETENVSLVITVSADISDIPEAAKKYVK